MNHTYILIMAGGEGTRFAPLSTPDRPKQFLNLVGDGTFVQQAMRRARRLALVERILVSTNERYVNLVREQLPEIAEGNIIAEPMKRNTAPALAYSARLIHERDPEATMICLPSDHHIGDEEGFALVMSRAVGVARDGFLVTLGMRPTWPSPDYGYIRPRRTSGEWSEVERFVEKPDAAAARAHIEEGCLWNGGIFAWKAEVFLDEIKRHAPGLSPCAVGLEPDAYFLSAPSISVDHAVLERSDRVAVIPADIGWSDVGTWEGLHRLRAEGGAAVLPEVARMMNEAVLPRRVEKPWGYEEIWAHTAEYVGKLLVIMKPHRLSYQYHRVKEETIRVLEGAMDLECEEGGERKVVRLNSGDTFHIAPGTKHRMIAIEDCRVIEVSTPHLADVVRVEDDYGRAE